MCKALITNLSPFIAILVDVGGLDLLFIYICNSCAIPLNMQVYC